MIALFIARLEDPTSAMILSVLLTAMGTAVATYGEVNMSLTGIAFMMASETGEAIRLVMTQYLLVGLKFHPIEGLMYLAPACSLWLAAGAGMREIPQIVRLRDYTVIYTYPTYFFGCAVMGFAVNGLAYTTIKLASSLTLKVLGTAKNAILVVVGIVFLQEVVTWTQGVGYMISLVGFSWYNRIKMTQILVQSPNSPGPKYIAVPTKV